MRKMFLSAALACLGGLLTMNAATACHGGWGGGWGGYYGGGWGGNYGRGYYGGYYGRGYHGGYYSSDYCYSGYSGGYGNVAYVVPSGGSYYAAAPASAPATLVVNLPADAVLTVDGKRTASTSAERVFSTPALESGRDFAYTLEAKFVRDGQEKVIKQRVTVRAGKQTTVRLEEPATAAAE
jgi:uncharacterized protein (TIGR03000 family)